MATPTEHWPSLFVSGNEECDVDDDSISLTSTLDSEHDSDEEFVVEAILAERPHENPTRKGENQYLVLWENYPLHRGTWEGIDNLSDELYQQWCEQRDREIRKKRVPFDVRQYEKALVEEDKRKAARHALRNAKRQRLHLPMTEPLPADAIDMQFAPTTKVESESDDEAMATDSDCRTSNITTQVASPEVASPELYPNLERAPLHEEILPQKRHSSSNQARPNGRQATARKPSEDESSTARGATASVKPTTVAPSASLANKFGKRLKATRSIVPKPLLQKQSTVAGTSVVRSTTSVRKIRKPRTNLKDAMMDPTKAPKFMNNMHRVNQLRKKGRELNDAAPTDPSAIPAGYFITTDLPQRKLGDGSDNQTIAQLPSAIAPLTGPKKARSGKTVRFMEDSTSIPSATHDLPEDRAGANVKKVPFQSYQQRATSQTIAKTVSFGSAVSRSLRVEFYNIPRSSSSDWLQHFLSEEAVCFQLVCSSADFLSGNTLYDIQDSQARLASGKLTSTVPEAQAALETVVSNLQGGASALYAAYPSYSILAFPPQCPAWEPLSSSLEGAWVDTLRYLVFKPRYSLQLEHYPALSSVETSVVTNSVHLRMKLLERLAEFDYNILLAPSAGEKHVFFLLFYPSETSVFHTLSLWLRACRPDCHIFHSQEPGAWNAYQEGTKSGAVILHEPVEKNIRNIPRLWDMLKHGAHTFWSFSSSDHEAALRSLDGDNQLISGLPTQLKLTQLFPAGRAFLITPSFVLSQPGKFCLFLEWFKKRAVIAPCVLVVCADFSKYLFDLAMEKVRECHNFRKKNSNDLLLKNLASSQGLSQKDHEYRVRAWQLISDLSDPSHCGFKSHEEPPEDIRKIVWADDLIAPDDEQSLVNWYGAWSMTRLDTYRKFYVLGSNADGIEQASRMVPVPNYLAGVANDPDKVAREELLATTPALNAFQSNMFGGDRAVDFVPWFNKFNHLKGTSTFWMFFKAISWFNMDMADRHGDRFADYSTYSQWLQACPKFWKKVNTLVGLFYTTEGDVEGDGQEEMPYDSALRHPWIALLRPVDPHLNPMSYSAVELLIWDCAARTRWPADPSREDLLPMQRALIDYVQKELPVKYHEYHLERVFVGGWNIDVEADPSYPIDITCKTFEAIVDGVDGRGSFVPLWEEAMYKAGWKLLRKTPLQFAQFPKISADDEESERLIFHAPRGERLPSRGSSCTNDLYDAAFRARKKDPRCTAFLYQYRPTLKWYQELKKEARSYKHMDVDSWDKVFKDSHVE
ncbi:hypothetical protein SUNI508_08724 [Seiridium unicorne]|uniref:Chromo domain-containing protein n=1 Tax=Seiridium unicorne TaxID=138068 RepID=A0ABR2USD7_9PEZI